LFTIDEKREISENEARRVSLGGDGSFRPRIMTLNVHGPTGKEKGNASMRKTMVQILLDRCKPDIVVLQEVHWTKLQGHLDLSFSKASKGLYESHINTTTSEKSSSIKVASATGIMWDSATFQAELLVLDSEWDHLLVYKDESSKKDIDLRERMTLMKMKPRRKDMKAKPMFVISFHGVNNGDVSLCTRKMLDFLQTFAESYPKFSVIVGGDWNEDLGSAKVILPPSSILYVTCPVRRFIRQIDHFMLFNGVATSTKLENVMASSLFDEQGTLDEKTMTSTEIEQLRTVTREAKKTLDVLEDTLDHDPIMAVIDMGK